MLPYLDEKLAYELYFYEEQDGREEILYKFLKINHSETHPGYWDHIIIDPQSTYTSRKPITFEGLCKYVIPIYGLGKADGLEITVTDPEDYGKYMIKNWK